MVLLLSGQLQELWTGFMSLTITPAHWDMQLNEALFTQVQLFAVKPF
jgi:hypothetical protein